MANENGHIYAPVSVDDVKAVLGETSNDVAALCMSKNINPYSLIRPMPVNVPWISVKDMKTQQIGDIPNSDENYAWERKQWGYQVPYVRTPALIETIKDISWYRPSADASHWKSLNHFDGYRHDAQPSFMWAIGNVPQGDEIVVMFDFGMAQDVVSETGKNNNGGIVGIMEVFGDEPFYYGVMIRYGGSVHYAYGNQIIPNETYYGTLKTGLIARAGLTYTITPFISDVDFASANQGKAYGLKFAPSYESSKTITIPELVSGATIRALTYAEDGSILTWELHLFNEFNYKMSVSNLILEVVEQGRTNDFPMRYSIGIGGNYEVDAQSDAVFTIERPIPFRGGVASKSATIVGSGTLVRVPYGNAVPFTTNMMTMEYKGRQ